MLGRTAAGLGNSSSSSSTLVHAWAKGLPTNILDVEAELPWEVRLGLCGAASGRLGEADDMPFQGELEVGGTSFAREACVG